MLAEYSDKGQYLRGILLLISKDQEITTTERTQVMEIGQRLGFDSEFCENAIDEILDNEYILKNPPRFISKNTSLSFIGDCLKISFSNNRLNPDELLWLKETAKENKISKEEFDTILRGYLTNKN